jgi:hypothetical protein
MSAATPNAATYDVATFPHNKTPARPQVPARQHREERRQRLGVEVVGRRPIRPWLEDEHGEHASADDEGEATVGGVVLQVLERPTVRDESGAGEGQVLDDQKVDRVRVHPVQQGQRPHDELEVRLVEGVAVVGVVPGVRRVVRVEVAGRDLLPGLAVLTEVGGQVEVVPQVDAVEDQEDELNPEDTQSDVPRDAERSPEHRAGGRRGRRSRRGRRGRFEWATADGGHGG